MTVSMTMTMSVAVASIPTIAVASIPTVTVASIPTVAVASVAGKGIEDRSTRIDDDRAFGRLHWLDRVHNDAGMAIKHPIKLWGPCPSTHVAWIERLRRQCDSRIPYNRLTSPEIEGFALLDRILSDAAVFDSAAHLKVLGNVVRTVVAAELTSTLVETPSTSHCHGRGGHNQKCECGRNQPG